MDNGLDRAVSSGSTAGLRLRWSAVFAGGLAAAALSLMLISFGAAIGFGASSSSPSWRDGSAALALLSGLYLILQASLSLGVGGYIAGRAQRVAVPVPVDAIAARHRRSYRAGSRSCRPFSNAWFNTW